MPIPEIWKPIPGYPGYEASNEGRVRSLPRIGGNNRWYGGIVLRHRSGGKNSPYATVYLGKGKPGSHVRVHYAILLAFVGPRPHGMICCHNNGDKLDNKLENLRYDTYQSNAIDKTLHGMGNDGEKHPLHKLSDDDVKAILREAINLDKRLAKRFNVSEAAIRHILSGRRRASRSSVRTAAPIAAM